MTGAAQLVDASRVVFAFARDNALPGSRYLKRVNHSTQTPVNAVWFVVVISAICGVLGFSATAFNSLARLASKDSVFWPSLTSHIPPSASVIGLYTSYAAPIFLRITSGRDKLKPGPFTLGRWAVPVGAIAVAWVAFIVVVLFFPPGQTINAQEMSMCINVISTFFKLTGTKIMPL